jgi:hypothetical protein
VSQLPPLTTELAEYWQAAKDDGTTALPPTFDPGGLTDQWADRIAVNRQAHVNAGNGLVTYYRFEADSRDATYAVALVDGSVLECGSIIEQETYVAGRGHRIGQPESRRNWGDDVRPGAYRAMLEVSEYTPCFQYSRINRTTVNGVTPPDDIAFVGIK